MKKIIIAIILNSILLSACGANEQKTSIAGIDLDKDGIRDDVEIAIHKLYPLSKDNREISRNAAKVYQLVLVAGDSENNLDDDKAAEELAKLVSCYNLHTELNSKKERAKIKAFVFDTQERLGAFEKFKIGRNGTVQRTVEAIFDDCRLPEN